jgi:hypothetical protein
MVSIYLKFNWIDAMNNMVAKLWIIQLNDINYGMNRNKKFKDRSKTDSHDIAEILLKVALNTINKKQT